MSKSIKTLEGDTFEIISRREFGTELEAGAIARVNPGVFPPLAPGLDVAVPTLPNVPEDQPQDAIANDADEVAILTDSKRFRFWDRVRVVRSLDAMDIVEFGTPWEPDVPGMKEAFQPFKYKPIDVTVGGDQLFTGTGVAVAPVQDNAQRVATISGYSLPGVLADCTAPASAFPLEFNDQGLEEIAKTLAKLFGLGVDFQGESGPPFDRLALEPGEKVFDFLVGLAKQRNVVIASTTEGKLLFWNGVEGGSPVARLKQGFSPLLSITPFFTPQEYFSSVSGIIPVMLGQKGSQVTVQNARLLGVIRPLTFEVEDMLDEAEAKAAVEAKAGRMFGNMASYTVNVNTWRDANGALWEPNTIISVEASGAMIYSEYKFVIRTVEFNRSAAESTASLNLVIPGSFNGKIPDSLPWDL